MSIKYAAQYLRMSTEHQRYSLENQAAEIATYAASRGFKVIETYTDAGKSGVTVRGRDGLKAMLADVVGGSAAYSDILVYDVSRWGRFQARTKRRTTSSSAAMRASVSAIAWRTSRRMATCRPAS